MDPARRRRAPPRRHDGRRGSMDVDAAGGLDAGWPTSRRSFSGRKRVRPLAGELGLAAAARRRRIRPASWTSRSIPTAANARGERHVRQDPGSGRRTARSERPLRVLGLPGGPRPALQPAEEVARPPVGAAATFAQLWDLTAPPASEPLQLPVGGVSRRRLGLRPVRPLARHGRPGVDLWPLGESYPRSVGPARLVRGRRGLHARRVDPRVRFRRAGQHAPRVVRCRPTTSDRRAHPAAGGRMNFPGSPSIREADGWPSATRDGRVVVVPVAGGATRTLEGLLHGYRGRSPSRSLRMDVAWPPRRGRGPAEDKVIRIWDLESGAGRVLGPLPGAGEDSAGGVSSLVVPGRRPHRGEQPHERRPALRSAGRVGTRCCPPVPPAPWSRVVEARTVFAVLREPDEVVRISLDGRRAVEGLLLSPLRIRRPGSSGDGRRHRQRRRYPAHRTGLRRRAPSLLRLPSAAVQRVAFSPDGRWVASSGERPASASGRCPTSRGRPCTSAATTRCWPRFAPGRTCARSRTRSRRPAGRSSRALSRAGRSCRSGE